MVMVLGSITIVDISNSDNGVSRGNSFSVDKKNNKKEEIKRYECESKI